MFRGFGFNNHPFFFDDFGVDRSTWADKSVAATAREEQAIAAFNKAREDTEARDDLVPVTRVKIELLAPSCHLTHACVTTFRKHVMSFPGWTVRRRAASEDEKKIHKVTRKTKVYFTDVHYTAPLKENKTPHYQESVPVNENKRHLGEQNEEKAGSEDLLYGSSSSSSSKKSRVCSA